MLFSIFVFCRVELEKRKMVCVHFLRGKCIYGDSCYKIHPKTEEKIEPKRVKPAVKIEPKKVKPAEQIEPKKLEPISNASKPSPKTANKPKTSSTNVVNKKDPAFEQKKEKPVENKRVDSSKVEIKFDTNSNSNFGDEDDLTVNVGSDNNSDDEEPVEEVVEEER
jgi:hypothetical protein